MDVTEGRIKAEKLDIIIEESDNINYKKPPNKFKVAQVSTLPQKIQYWLIVFLSASSLITNISNIAYTLGQNILVNSTLPCPKTQ